MGQTQDDAAGEAFRINGQNAGTAISRWPIDRQIRKSETPGYHFPEPQVAGIGFRLLWSLLILYFSRMQAAACCIAKMLYGRRIIGLIQKQAG